MRGLPFSATSDEIIKFFSESKIAGGKDGIHLTFSRDGRPSGEAFVEFTSDEDLEKAVEKHNEHMGHRYIEVFKTKASEMEWVVGKASVSGGRGSYDVGGDDEGVVRLRGLPFGCSKEEISQFFNGFEIVPNGIALSFDHQGRSTGEAYVQFINKKTSEEAIAKRNKERIGHRYIEIFKSSTYEIGGMGAMGAMGGRPMGGMGGPMGMGRPGPYDRGDRYGPIGGPMGRYGGPGGYGNVRGPGGMYGYGGYGGGGYGGPAMGMPRGGYGGGFGGPAGRNAGPPGANFHSTTGHSVHMRGLPFRASESDVIEFFSPLVPAGVHIHYENNGRATGEADVEFESHRDAAEGMKKDKQNMQHRYIELFLNSAENAGGGGGGGGRRGDFRNGGYGGYGGYAGGGDYGYY